ncbi:MAG TPA: NADH-quinone oxidoreductase subunit N [Anaerolineae bacterium]|nr:NADH-quinone oxidoreductase subunit N [Anaerolineae bacterium]
MIQSPAISLWPHVPEVLLLASSLVILVAGLFLRPERRKWLAGSAMFAVLAAMAAVIFQGAEPVKASAQDMLLADRYALFLKVALLAAAALALLFSIEYVERTGLAQVEYYGLLLLSVAGMLLMVEAVNLVTIFLSLEVASIALYVLVGLDRAEARSAAASLKYLLLGAVASAFLLYGMALVYGQAGTTSLSGIEAFVDSLGEGMPPLLLVGLGLVVVGLGFKVALVPFHLWTPDVYAGAPTSVTAFMSVGVKVVGFAALGRVTLYAFAAAQGDWQWLLAGLAALTMTVGNLAALLEKDLKRLLAYSGVAQAGYILVGLAAAGEEGVGGALFYLFAYVFANTAAFGVVTAVARWHSADSRGDTLESYAGLAERRPWLAVAMSLCLLSLAGFPPLAGFMSKLYVFASAIRGGMTWLAVVGVLNSAIAAYYYLRLIGLMVGRRERQAPDVVPSGAVCPALIVGLALACLATVLLGIWPEPFLEWARAAARSLLGG